MKNKINLIINENKAEINFAEEIQNSLLFSLLNTENVDKNVQFEINRTKNDIHILEGLIKMIEQLDKSIEIVRSSENTTESIEKLTKELNISEKQAENFLKIELSTIDKIDYSKLKNNLIKYVDFLETLTNN